MCCPEKKSQKFDRVWGPHSLTVTVIGALCLYLLLKCRLHNWLQFKKNRVLSRCRIIPKKNLRMWIQKDNWHGDVITGIESWIEKMGGSKWIFDLDLLFSFEYKRKGKRKLKTLRTNGENKRRLYFCFNLKFGP